MNIEHEYSNDNRIKHVKVRDGWSSIVLFHYLIFAHELILVLQLWERIELPVAPEEYSVKTI